MENRPMDKTLQYPVRYALRCEFRRLVEGEGCKIVNVIETISRQVITYIIDVPDDKVKIVEDYAFMTFITNEAFQKYYKITPALLENIRQDNEAYEFAKRNKSLNNEIIRKKKVRFLEAIFWQQFDFVNKKPIGICIITPAIEGVFNIDTKNFEFPTIEGTGNTGFWNNGKQCWSYYKKDISPIIPESFFNKDNVWMGKKISFQIS